MEQAVHKKVEIRTRSQLVHALNEQEDMNAMLEENMKEYPFSPDPNQPIPRAN